MFVGFGITAPRFGHDDYAGIDVKGKIAVVLSGNPLSFPSEEGAYYGNNFRTKRELAARHGAIGYIVLPTPRSERAFPFALSRRFSDALAMDWVRGDGRASSDVPWAPRLANVSTAAGVKLFSRSVSISTRSTQRSTQINRYHGWPSICPQECRPRARGPRPAAATSSERRRQRPASKEGVRRLHRPPRPPRNQAGNGGRQHLQRRDGQQRSGVATLIEMARLIAQMPVKPKRSMLFIALTGEEKGLRGSDYFATNPTVPASSIVACVNFDMPILTYDFSNVVAFGAEHSNLKEITATAAAELGLALVPDPVVPSRGSLPAPITSASYARACRASTWIWGPNRLTRTKCARIAQKFRATISQATT